MMALRQPIHSYLRWATPQVKRVISALASCEACGGISFGRLCTDCRDHSQQHVEDDPYDIVGGEGGGFA